MDRLSEWDEVRRNHGDTSDQGVNPMTLARMAIRRSVRPDELAPAAARGMLVGLQMEPGLHARAELVMSELVTNCVRHAGMSAAQPIRLVASLAPVMLRLEVTDEGDGFEPVVSKESVGTGPGGWGLWLVDKFADRWGLEHGHSTQVWCEFDRTL